MKYKLRSGTVEAMQVKQEDKEAIWRWLNPHYYTTKFNDELWKKQSIIVTGKVMQEGEWIIRDGAGVIYFCPDNLFTLVFEKE